MIIDILKERFKTDDAELAIVRSWSKNFRSAPSLAAGLIELGYNTDRSQIAAIESANTSMLVNARKLTSFAKFIGEPLDFNKFEIEIKFNYVLLSESGNQCRDSDRMEQAVDRQVANITAAFRRVLGSSVIVFSRSFLDRIIITIKFDGVEKECNERFPSIAEYTANMRELNNRPTVIKETETEVRRSLVEEVDNDYCACDLAVKELSAQREELNREMDRLEKSKAALGTLIDELKFRNRNMSKKLTYQKLDEDGYNDAWRDLRHKVSDIADEDIIYLKSVQDPSYLVPQRED